MRITPLLLACLCLLAATAAVPASPGRIGGGSLATISEYPFAASVLYGWDGLTFWQGCSGTVITTRSLLSSANCFTFDTLTPHWRIRVGSSLAHSGGSVHPTSSITLHPGFTPFSVAMDNDIAIIRAGNLFRNSAVKPATLSASIIDTSWTVRAIGWGETTPSGGPSEELQHASLSMVPEAECRERLRAFGATLTGNMACVSGSATGRGQCAGDEGAPVVHAGAVVGVFSWRPTCLQGNVPGVNMVVARYLAWIRDNQ